MATTEIKTTKITDFSIYAKEVLNTEINALQELHKSFHPYSCNQINFNKTCHLILNCKGKVILTGMGKSGHIANKIAATLASLGTPSFFIHPSEALHGDIGMLNEEDIVIAISYSGASEEILQLIPSIKRLGIPIISITGNKNSYLAQNSNAHIDAKVPKEACPLGLAPTASTTTALAVGDAIAVALIEAKNFTPKDFALSHPGGSLGRKLILKTSDIMVTNQNIPLVLDTSSLKDALITMTSKKLGIVGIKNIKGNLIGVYTDGDLRRTLEQQCNNINFNEIKITKVMNSNFITINQDTLASEAMHIMEKNKISSSFVLDNNKQITGALNLHTLLQNKII